MKEFVCTSCQEKWYSAADIKSPCEKCGGSLKEVQPDCQILAGGDIPRGRKAQLRLIKTKSIKLPLILSPK